MCIIGPLWSETTVDRRIPYTKDQVNEKYFHAMTS